jgi:hypothetical protein
VPHPERVRAALESIAESDPDLLRAPVHNAEPRSVMFTIRTLPGRALSTNGSKRDHHEVSGAKMALGAEAYNEALYQLGPDMPRLTGRVDIALTFYVKHHARTGDGLYRPLDPSNIGGECIKPVIDYGLVKHGVIADDDYTHVRYVVLSIQHVEELRDERIEVRAVEVVE